MRTIGYLVGAVAVILAATATSAIAGEDFPVAVVPELNPNSLAAGLGVVTGGVLLVRAWLRK